ncbi:DoxX family protein [Mucilaginibacter sp. RS28]|uniref:DoxX family protein n=1 Tax=Mucilaginibacter straminoryzae TaxID=2932774 RepID=A0A9X1WZH2_9SPHI|nr:DoxX family protein [Mucilaginibacter straminoryzae]MCJ8208283.1 DoxX family protein [Mucilaginibacter straminoryzae]
MTTLTVEKVPTRDKVIYWVFTSIFFLFDSVMPALTFNSEMAKQGVAHMGFPDYFRIELSIGKIIGGLLLILPFIPARFKEWAYVGFGISIISAFIANIAMGSQTSFIIMPVVVFAVLLVSYIYYHKIYQPFRKA